MNSGLMMKKWMSLLTLIVFMSLLVGCDGTDLEGEIVILSDQQIIGVSIPVQLIVPEDLEEIHMVMWNVFDEEGNSLLSENIFLSGEEILEVSDEGWVEETYKEAIDKVDRMGLFMPTKEGTYTIEVVGFYRQTNPQPITSIEILVVD